MQQNRPFALDTNIIPLWISPEKLARALVKGKLSDDTLQSKEKFRAMCIQLRFMSDAPVSISIRQLAHAMRKAEILPTPFVTIERKCLQFQVAAEFLGFSRREVAVQIETEKTYLAKVKA